MTSSLTDRYVWAVVRTQPESARPDLEAELRERIADAIDARLADGVQDDVVERVVLTELGDPDRLAASYADTPLHLIGPKHYLSWWRLLKLLLVIVVPITAAAMLLAGLIDRDPVGEIAANTIAIPLSVGVHLAFWVTLAFAIVERVPGGVKGIDQGWTPELLPEPPTTAKAQTKRETIASVVFLAVLALVLIGQQFFTIIGNEPVPVVNPALWSFWLPYFLVLIGAEIAFAIALYLNRGWTPGFAIANFVLTAAFAIPALWLLATGQLVNPAFVTAVTGAEVDEEAWRIITLILTGVFVLVSAWDIVDGFRRLRRDRKALAS